MHGNLETKPSSPLSPAQRDLLLDFSRSQGTALHMVGTSIELGHDVDPERWQRAAEAVFSTEPGMRLRLVWRDGEPWQELDPEARLVTLVHRLDRTEQPELGPWVMARLSERSATEGVPPFVHALVREESGSWHAVLMAPHVFIDGHAFRYFFERTSRIYEEGSDDTSASLEPLFRAVGRATHRMDLPETLAFWRDQLADVSPLLYRTPRERDAADVDQVELLSQERSAAVEAFCRESGLHPSDFFLGVYAIVLERFRERSGRWVVHAIRSTRGPDERDLMGCFYRAMPMVLDADALTLSSPVGELLTGLCEARHALRGQMRISMLALQDLLPRESTRAIFNYYDFNQVHALGAVRELRSYIGLRSDELHLIVVRRPEGFELRLRFNTSTFTEGRLLPRLAAVTGQIVSGAKSIADCDWLLSDERPAVLLADSFSSGPMVEERIAQQVRATPEATALTFGTDRISYRQLEAASNRLAHRLVGAGVGPDTLVGVLLEPSFELVATVLAVLKAGGAFVPIDPDYPEERVRFILADSRLSLLVARATESGESRGECMRRIAVGDLREDFPDEPSDPPTQRASPDDLAYVIYTSGSTGRPKGTLVRRRNLASLLTAARPLYGFDASDTWTLLHSCAFDFSVWETFGALAFGGRLIVVDPEVVRSPPALARLIDHEGVTVLNQTPSAFLHLAAVPSLAARTLRFVIFGGEALETEHVRGWFERFGDASPRLVNMYGITETTVHVTHRPLTRQDALGTGSPIGRPLPGWDVYLVDHEGRLVPRGCSGEMWVGGAGVARGYLDRDELTRERFQDDPFVPGTGRRVYRSGDLARERPDGDLDFLGRIDDQVKIRGYRVEPGEVAEVLATHPSVRQSVVVAHPGTDGPYLVGYVVASEPGVLDEAALLRFLRLRLPSYMTCARVVEVDSFPLTPHGKLDRKSLPVPAGRPPEIADFVPPRTATEELVASVFAEATGSDRVGAEDDFFDLGGHSLSAMRVAARLQQLFQVPAGPSLLFEHPTVAAVAEYVDRCRDTVTATSRPEFPAQDRREELPLTFAQERVFLLQKLHPALTAYNFEAEVRFRGRLDPARLGEALRQLVERHEAYRTTFHEENGRLIQRVHARGEVFLEELDLSAAPLEEAKRQAEAFRRNLASRVFDPGTLPLAEWRLVRLSSTEHVLSHREHHLIHDGWSFVVFLRDLLEIYRALGEDRPPRLPATVALGDYAAGHRRWIEGPAGEEQRRYWRSHLADLPARLDLPTDRRRPAVFSFRGDQLVFDLPGDLVERLRAAARREGLTLYMTMLGAFSLLLARLADTEDLTVGAGVANRRWEEIENTVGMLLNNVVFRLQPRREISVRDYLRQVRDEVLAALARQDLPFGDIVSAAGVPRSLTETPLVQAFFSSYEGPLPELSLPDLEVEFDAGLANGTAKFDWNVIVISRPGESSGQERVTVLWEYATDLFTRASLERARTQFVTAIGSLIEDFDRPLAEVSISGEEERRFLMEAAEGAHTDYPRSSTIPELFARQVAERAGATALSDGSEKLTYSELERRSGRVASELIARGVTAGEPVAFLVPRGAAAVTAMLGILRAGGAYVPLAPNDPPARLAWLVADAGVRRVLTSASLADKLTAASAKIIDLDRVRERPLLSPATPARSEDLAAVLFTSGSTGEPKGVEVVHRGIVRLLFGADYASLGPREKILQLAPLSFDASTFEIWGALLHGGELVIVPEDLPSIPRLGELIERHGITTMWLNASLFNSIVDQDPAVLAPLAQLLVGGEALSVAHIERARRVLRSTTLVNGYGPTENTTFSCCYRIPDEIDPALGSIPIGRPIAHSRARVLDARGALVAGGAIGEIWVGGDGLARGYRNREESTAESFVRDPFAAAPGDRLYRTGDLGRVLPDGNLEFRGRRDSQVKIRGFRIEPGEVEAALCRLPGVAEASVVPMDDPARGRHLVAFVVAERGCAIDPDDIRESLSRQLPPYLLPTRIIARAALPLTPHGKLDTGALVREAGEARHEEAWPAPAEPQSALEGVIATAFAEVLGVDEFGADQDFFTAGGHSLLVFRVLARLQSALGVRLEPSVFLQGPTPRRLALEIERRSGEALEQQAEAVEHFVVKVSSGQRPLFFVPGGEGGDFALGVYARLALHLPASAFYAFRVTYQDGRMQPEATSVEELAGAFVSELLKIRPRGDFDLAGGCVGGLVAYEIARQLARAGRPPRTLVLLDTVYPTWRRRLRQRGRRHSALIRRKVLAGLGRLGVREETRQRLYRKVSALLPFDETDASPVVPSIWMRFADMILAYRPRPMRARATLLASRELIGTDSVRRWTHVLGDALQVRELPGTHWSYIRAHLKEVGSSLEETLEAPE